MDLISGLRQAAAASAHALHPDLAAAFSLDGRGAVVTGAASGLGRQAAVTYAQAGATLVLADRDEEGLAATAAAVDGAGGRCTVVPTDVSDKIAVEDLARAALKAAGRVDVWANVAGVIRRARLVDVTVEDVDALVGVNLAGALWGTAAAGRVMAPARRGSVVNVASAGGEMPAPTVGVYGMTKAAVIQLTRTAAAELGAGGIRVNAVAPGFVETPMTAQAWLGDDGSTDGDRRTQVLAGQAKLSPLGVTGQPTDVALAMLYLAADASKFVTGQVLRPNGGVHMP